MFSLGCKDENELGLNILPTSDLINTVFSDTSTVITSTAYDDSVRTDELSIQLLGSDSDQVFGTSNAGIFAQVNLEGTPAFGLSADGDSIFLSLAYLDYYGDTTTAQTVHVYRLIDPMYIDSTYYSWKYFTHDSLNELGSLNFSPKPNSWDTVNNLPAIPQIRIRLADWLADSIVAQVGSGTFLSNELWLNYFKGIYIKADPISNAGAISYLNFFNSKLTMYFHNTIDTTAYVFSLTGSRVNRFNHNHATLAAGNHIGNPADTVNFLQSMAGLKTTIKFPYLKHFKDSGSILIHRAELSITAEPGGINTPLPDNLILITRNSAGEKVFPVDYYETSGYYGGNLNPSTNVYTFNIARHLQRYVDGIVDNADFELIVSGNGVIADRAVIKSGSSASNRMKLSIYYTKLN